jgi:hypothetical protein
VTLPALHLASYPLPYIDKTTSTYNSNIGYTLVLIVIFAIMLLAWCWFVVEDTESTGEYAPTRYYVGCGVSVFLLLGCLGVGIWTAQDARHTDDRTAAASRAVYDHSVIQWMSAEYGITIDEDALHKLTAGKTLVVSYAGADTLIQFAERADKGLAVRIPDGSLLTPVTK